MKMKKWSLQWTQFMQLRKEAWKKNSGLQRGLNPWPRDTGAMLYQLSYEATDVGSRSIVGSYVPVKEMSVNDIWNKLYMNCGNEMNWPAPNVSGFIAQLVEHRTGNREVTGSNPVEVLNFFFQASSHNCVNCIHCDNHFFIFTISCVINCCYCFCFLLQKNLTQNNVVKKIYLPAIQTL